MKHGLVAVIVLACTPAIGLSDEILPRLDTRDSRTGRYERSIAGLRYASEVEQRGVGILVRVQANIDADCATSWTTLTEYDKVAAFIPEMTSSRTVWRFPNEALLEHKGVVKLGPTHHRFTVFVHTAESAPESLSISATGPDFSLFQGRFEIASLAADRSRVVFDATIVPRRPLAARITMREIQEVIDRQFAALTREIERRAIESRRFADRGTR